MYFDVTTKIFKEENIEANKLAFVAADKNITWSELKILSDKIGDTLKTLNLPAFQPILIYGDKEAFFLASILSCYQLNFSFVIIDPILPAKRIEKIIEQTQSNVIIVCTNYENAPVLPISINCNFEIKKNSNCFFYDENNITTNTAYILFTSGSTGEPKGVLISNENISTFAKWFTKEFSVSKETVFINQATFLFDISLADFFGTLQTGGTAIFNTSAVTGNTHLFFNRINTYQGNYWNSTPSFIYTCLADKNFNEIISPSINQFVLSGENLSTPLVKDLKLRFPKATIINAYGPTEATIFSSFIKIEDGMLNENTLPICKIGDEYISINENEIIISGQQVGLGYLNNEKQTQEKFPFIKKKQVFKTGDVTWIKNGYIYFSSRKDDQIKFNGYRIELNEITSALQSIDFIEQATCLPIIINDRVKRLIAFVKLKNEKQNDILIIKAMLEKQLPTYMIPSEIIDVKEFPLTTSSKIDKKKLLENYLAND